MASSSAVVEFSSNNKFTAKSDGRQLPFRSCRSAYQRTVTFSSKRDRYADWPFVCNDKTPYYAGKQPTNPSDPLRVVVERRAKMKLCRVDKLLIDDS